tara:strand:+ start:85 stop:456 length:372 start_codon:yes stop_codon:yes gene_type:complete
MTEEKEERKYSYAELVLRVEQVEGSDAARYIKDKMIEGLVKQKRTAVKIAAAAYGSAMATQRCVLDSEYINKNAEEREDVGSKVIEDSIWQSDQFYKRFSAEWITYCESFWTKHIHDEDGLPY